MGQLSEIAFVLLSGDALRSLSRSGSHGLVAYLGSLLVLRFHVWFEKSGDALSSCSLPFNLIIGFVEWNRLILHHLIPHNAHG